MSCSPGLVFGGTKVVGSRFHVLHARTRFRRYRRRRVPFSCFAHPDSFSAVQRASVPIFLFCVPERAFSGSEGVGSRFRVLRARTRFHLYRGRRIPFPCFAIPYSFSTVPRVVRSRFHILRFRTHFRRYRVCPIPFSCFPLSDMFSAVSRASGPFFKFYALGHIFGGIEGVRSLFHFLRSRTRFRWYRGRRVPFSRFTFPD
jgi:hypothetical protein